MKKSLNLLLAGTLVVLGACSKESVKPAQSTTALEDTSWRMTAYNMEFGARSSTARTSHDFFRAYSSNQSVPCLGLNTLTFVANGQVIWNNEVNGCALYATSANQTTTVAVNWGVWSTTNTGRKLVVTTKGSATDYSSLPVMYSTLGAYEIVQFDGTTLVLGATHIIGRNQDSVQVDRAVFTRIP